MSALQKEFESYRDAIYPDGVSPAQEKKTRQDFVCGVLSGFNLAMQPLVNLSGSTATIQQLALLKEIKAECVQFLIPPSGSRQ